MMTDCHLHTKFSGDSTAEPTEIVAFARERNLNVIFTDHCECGQIIPPEEPDWDPFDASGCLQTLSAYRGEHVGVGVELGQAFMDPELAKRVTSMPWDVVLGSLHNIRDTVDFCFIDYDLYDDTALVDLYRRYLTELYDFATWGNFDVLSHLTYPVRYLARKGRTFDLSVLDDEIMALFRLIAQQGRALEVNTSGLSDSAHTTFPSMREVRMFRSVGGELITLGSDAHNAKDIGRNFSEAAEMLKESGFRYAVTYRERKPFPYKID